MGEEAEDEAEEMEHAEKEILSVREEEKEQAGRKHGPQKQSHFGKGEDGCEAQEESNPQFQILTKKKEEEYEAKRREVQRNKASNRTKSTRKCCATTLTRRNF